MSEQPDEFDWIAALRPLTRGAPAALGLMDDVAVLPTRPGFDIVVSEDAMVEGVHFLPGEAASIVARRLLRTSLSDLAAKAAEPFGYTLTVAWPPARGWDERMEFIRGLDEDGMRFDVALLGGDTVSTAGPLTVSATVFGWTPAGRLVRRSGAREGHALVVCGSIGDGGLGLMAARGEIADPGDVLAQRYRLPQPLFALRGALRTHAAAAADVSDGLIADALHIAEASQCGVTIDLASMPVSEATRAWLVDQPDRADALLKLASAGDDYAIVCAAADGPALVQAALDDRVPAAVIGGFRLDAGLDLQFGGQPLAADRHGWRHR
jgi:thiamine-monophosphate kinase